MSYYELWSVLSQWREEFTVREFSSTFASPDPNKVLFDLCRKGLLAKEGRGKYRVVSQGEYVKTRSDVSGAYERVRGSGIRYAFTGVDSVFVWTRGGYNVGRFFGFYPIHLKVRKRDLAVWQNFLRSSGQRFVVEGRPAGKTLFGVFYVFHPVGKLARKEVEGYFVDSLAETVGFCRDNIYTYEPALEMLQEMYHLRLGLRSEFSTRVDLKNRIAKTKDGARRLLSKPPPVLSRPVKVRSGRAKHGKGSLP